MLLLPQREESAGKEIDVLVADDEKVIQDLLGKFLKSRGYNTCLASNAREALRAVRGNNIKVAIVDIKMPGFIDGLKVLRRIKKMNNRIEVIMMTGFGNAQTRKLSNDLGAYAYLEKPFDLNAIDRFVESALEKEREFL
jgi:DNA-binding NtrC family response regulator